MMIIILLLLFNTFFSKKEETKKFNYESQIGVIDVNEQQNICLNIANNNLLEGSQLVIVLPGTPQSVLKATILKKENDSCSRNADIDPKSTFYTVRLLEEGKDREKMREQGIAIAIVGIVTPVNVTKSVVRIDLDGDGKGEAFKSCTSYEGIHLTIWSGKLFKGKRKRRWHHYYYLGYDVEPSCKTRDI